MPFFDFAKLAMPQVEMVLRLCLIVHGLTAKIYPPVIFDNEYQDVLPEIEPDEEPRQTCKILLGQPMVGLSISQYVRLSLVTREVPVTTNMQLEPGTQLVVTHPDGKVLNLRLIEAKVIHAASTQAFRYMSVMT